MRQQIEHLRNDLTDKVNYTDIHHTPIYNGDTLLFINDFITRKINAKRKKNRVMITGKIGVFYNDNTKNIAKVFVDNGSEKPIVVSIFPNSFYQHNKLNNNKVVLDCVKGDFSNMDANFKEITNYNKAIEAFNNFFNK